MNLRTCSQHPNIAFCEEYAFQQCPMCVADKGYVKLDKLCEDHASTIRGLRAKIADLEGRASAQLEESR